MLDYIFDDALIQILKYLPARNIVRLRSVCKSWKELIDSDELMLKHLALQKPSFLVKYGSTDFVVVEIGCQPLTHVVRCPIQGDIINFIGTHHGIVCLDAGGRNISLWNPSTGKLSSILLPVGFSFDDHCEVGWGCCRSFCIDPFTKEYQIIILFFKEIWEDDVTVNGILYLSIEKGWSVIPEQEIEWGWYFGLVTNNLLVEGVAYWTDDLVEAVLSFDFSQKIVELIKLPHEISEFGEPIELIQWKGAFSVLCFAPDSSDTFQIQTRKEGSWISMFRFKVSSPESPLFLMAMAETDKKFWVLYNTLNDMMRKQSELRPEKGSWMYYRDLNLYESGVGCTRLRSGDKTPITYNFVESLLFPQS